MYFRWRNAGGMSPMSFDCGHCGRFVGANQGYQADLTGVQNGGGRVYICPYCTRPTFAAGSIDPTTQEFTAKIKVPGSLFGTKVTNLPPDVETVYDEARKCMSFDGHSAAVLLCRKLLMHVAVERNAQPNLRFIEYIGYLVDNGYVAPTNRGWVDQIRNIGNEAAHEITPVAREDAENLIEFSEMVLKTIYEYPARANRNPGSTPGP